MAGVTVTVVNPATNQIRTTTTNATGDYSAPFLVPGIYNIRVEATGFKVETRTGVELQVGAIARINVTLQVGGVTPQVEVGGGLQGGQRSQASYSIGGQRLATNRYTLDGTENTDPNFNSYIIQPSVDFIQEFKVQTGVHSAEFGSATSQIGATTKSGTNRYHGATYEFLRNSAFDAQAWNTTSGKTPFRRNQYGFTLGGPIQIPKLFNGKDRLFFPSNWEELRDRTTSQSFASVATDRMRAGDFSVFGAPINRNIFDPLTRVYNSSGLWKVTSEISLSLGLRYENTQTWHDKYRGIMNVQIFDPGAGPKGILANTKLPIYTRPGKGDFYEGMKCHFADGQLTQSGDEFMGRGLVNPDNNNFGPPVSSAYSPTSNWTFRGGSRVFFAQDSGNAVVDMGRNLGGRDSFAADSERPSSNFSDPWLFERQSFKCAGWSGTCIGAPQFPGKIQGNRTPYVFQWLFNIQRQLTQHVVLEIGYQGIEAHKLQRFRLYSQAIPKTGPTDARTITRRSPWPTYGRLQEVDGGDNSNYHALSSKLTQRFHNGLTYMIGYRWSKALDGGSAIRTNAGDVLWPDNSYDLRNMRGPAQFDIPRRFAAPYVYELPFGKGKPLANVGGLVNAIIGGWQFGGIVTLADGGPIASPGPSGDSANLNVLAMLGTP